MVQQIKEFDSVSINNASVQFKKGGTYQPGTPFGCIGTVDTEPQMKTITKKCGGVDVKTIAVIEHILVQVTAHIPVEVARNLFGLTNDGLKEGVYAIGEDSKGLPFIFTADVIDEFEDVVKKIAFSNTSNNSGFKLSVENGAEEVALLELEFKAMRDENGKFYYEAFEEEIDSEIKTKWHTQFTPELVALASP